MFEPPKKLRYFINGEWRESKTNQYMNCYNPSTGEVIALAPQCTADEVEAAVDAAREAFPAWSEISPNKRVQILFRMKALLDQHLEELTHLVATENGKVWDEAMGDVLKVTEVVEFACGIPHLMKGPALMNATPGYDTSQYLEPLGVFVGIAPWNFPAMIPMGWMAPICIATGNTFVLKAASFTPQTSMRILELWQGDCALERSARGIVNSACGCAGERCMALPTVVVEECIADPLVAVLKQFMAELKIGPAYDKTSQLGPLVNAEHRQSVLHWIQKGIEEGAELVLDGRNVVVPGFEQGFYLGPTIFDHVGPGMTIGDREIFGPVLCVKRVRDFQEGLELMNRNEFGNGSVIYTQNGYYAREFARRTHGGMVGINVGIPVPLGVFGFTGHKNSFFGDLHTMGMDGVRFFTELKSVTAHWFSEEEAKECKVLNSWDGMISMPDQK
ncbi:MAG: aldehyde dehydrogenase family protein [Coprothermobacterota bacterium]|nr:aldehyde dehydrogenase family protein [Coprothermobacterota bacterium]